MSRQMTGAEMIVEALKDQGVDTIFGYPGGAVLPIYDALFHQNKVRHVLVRHEQGAAPCGRRLCALDRQGRRAAGDLGPRRDQCGDGPHRRADGFDPARLHHRPGADSPDRLGRLPGMRHGRHHAPLHQAQLSREADRGSAAHPARGLLRGGERSSRPGRDRRSEGRAVRDRDLHDRRARRAAQDLSAPAQGRPRQDQAARRHDGRREEAGLLYRRRRHQFGHGGLAAAARAGAPDRLPDHLDADGARRLSRARSAMAGHARHARHLRGQQCDARLRSDDRGRRALRRPHHRTSRRLLAELEEDPHRHRSVVDQQERQGRPRHRRRLRAMCSKTW